MKHELKIWPQYFCRVIDGSKTFEVRENDRGFQPGDAVILREWNPEPYSYEDEYPMGSDTIRKPRGYTGEARSFKIGYVMPIDDKRVVFSLLPDRP